MEKAENCEGILMAKAMKKKTEEEEYKFLRRLDEMRHQLANEIKNNEDVLEEQQEERNKRRHQRELREKEKQLMLEEIQREKCEQWRSQSAGRAAKQEKILKDKANSLKQFHKFQKRALEEVAFVPRIHSNVK
ncbi:uncharacterized protein LOC106705025 [Latimeria chalumnae]|uniref:uncharacterized protein LOC106705025 n=1 Tax=Latimeria chalumnae TaxID=7897 RepID=UPI0006D918EF|nr:PREDICTED: golgin subfamily A member 6-like protein 2 [Latimeria chalumnae]XP_014348892.1 PREDICTED: golgin subfamily A member 6-like protein 2 [Latimeria chalumnae]|eukprot:XP_014348891.1 PREDICTED: golgin subfamily A member 6-like protein 2 [Latimeria chalumnae]